jgi:Tfp pilus assembly protein PilO
MSQRERYIVIGTIAVVALFALDYLFLSPQFERYKALEDQINADLVQVDHNNKVFKRARESKQKWAEMTAGALKRDASTTESQLIDSIGQWAQDARMSVSYKPERTEKQKDFVKVTYRATCNGSMSQLRTFLLHVQRASIPIRLTDLQVSSRPEGTDALQISMGISTVYLAPESDKDKPGTPRPPAAAAAGAATHYREAF